MRTLCGYADLLVLEDALGAKRLAAVAHLVGYEAPAEPPPARGGAAEAQVADERGATAASTSPAAVRPSRPPLRPTPFWRVTSRERIADDEQRKPRVAGRLTPDDTTATAALPLAPDLMAWARLRQRLHRLLAWPRVGRAVDQPYLLQRAVRREPITRVPRARQRRFPRSLWLVADRTDRLLPCWTDQDRLEQRLKRLLPPKGLVAWTLCEGPSSVVLERAHGTLRQPLPSAPLLVLSDLGAYGDASDRAAWKRFAREQIRRGHALHVLAPVPRERWPADVAALGQVEPWDRSRASAGARDSAALLAAARGLLRTVAWLTFIEPGLLRAVRFAHAADECDIGTEFDAWRLIADQHVCGGTLAGELREELLAQELAAPDANTRERLMRVVAEIERWRRAYSPLVALEERIVWRSTAAVELGELGAGSEQDDRDQLERLNTSLRAGEFDRSRLAAWVERVWMRAPARARDMAQLAAVWRTAREGVMPGMPRTWAVEQHGAELVFRRTDFRVGDRVGMKRAGRGSSLGAIEAASPLLSITPLRGGRGSDLHMEAALTLHDAPIALASDRERIVVELLHKPLGVDAIGRDRRGLWVEAGSRGERLRFVWRPPESPGRGLSRGAWEPRSGPMPAWSTEVGCDEIGVWAEVVVRGVRARFRRIPGGRFVMGSPEREEGRETNERQHEVELSGFWLGETVVTQELWTAVMSENPSYFKSANRPVEQVSWEACIEFITKLNALVPGLDARMPTESEWEYACRAGTTTSTYAGEMQILGANNATLLNDIAWYGGNSGVGFDLDNGYDLSSWPEREFADSRSGTHPVATKTANPYGLYDMLGNVYEWCVDWRGEYPREPVVDPRGPASGDARVLRGGSWDSDARDVRAANRFAYHPGFDDDGFGVRLARGQGELPGAERGSREAEPRPAERARSSGGRGTRPKKPGWIPRLFGDKEES